jgi:hypothetical protein
LYGKEGVKLSEEGITSGLDKSKYCSIFIYSSSQYGLRSYGGIYVWRIYCSTCAEIS